MKQLYTIVIIMFSVVTAWAQTATISGRVYIDGQRGTSHVTLQLSGTFMTTVSDKNGLYTFRNVPFGSYRLLVSSLEIEPLERDINIFKPNHMLDIPLRGKDKAAIDEVLIVEHNENRKIETSGFAVAVIETQEASLRNLTTNELLDRAVGVRVRQNGGVGSQVEYNLNGMSGNAIGIFIDGIESTTYGSSFNLNNIPPAMIERIEVYKGVLPSHLSGNYIGGAINVVLKKNVVRNNVTMAASYGSFNTYNADVGVNYLHSGSGFTFRGSAFHTHSDNSYTTWGESTTYVDYMGRVTRPFRAKRFNNTYYSTAGRFEAGFTEVSWADVIFVGYNISKSYTEIPHGISMSTPYVGRFNEGKANVWSLNYTKNNLFTDGLSLNINATMANRNMYLQDTVTYQYNWDNTLREIIDDGERKPIRIIYIDERGQQQYMAQQGRPTMTDVSRQMINTRSNLAYTVFPGHRLSINHALRQTDRDDNDLLRPVDKDLVTISQNIQNILAFNYEAEFWQHRIRTNAQLKYTADRNNQRRVDFTYQGGERQIHRRDTSIFTDNIGYAFALAFRFAPKMHLVTSTETAFVSPTETQLFGEPEHNILPNRQLQPEKNVNFNLGVRTDPFELGKNRVSFYASAFWRNGYEKIIAETMDADTIQNIDNATIDVTRFTNLGMTQAGGFEAEVIYIYDNKINAAFNISKFNNLYKGKYDDLGNPNPYHNQQVVNEPYFNINTNVQYRLDNVFQRHSVLNLYYNFGYVHSYNIAWGNPDWGVTPKQFMHDLGASYRFPSQKVVLSLDIRNLLNEELYDNFKKQKPGRGFYLKLNYTIGRFY